jgi:hypothetical protein
MSQNNWNFIELVERIIPEKIEDDSPTTTKVKLWLGYGIGIWLIFIASGLALGYGVPHEVFGISNEIFWLLSGVILILLVTTRVGLKTNDGEK